MDLTSLLSTSSRSDTPTTETFASVLDRLVDVQPDGEGYLAQCPSHTDTHPSLVVSYNPQTRRVLLNCRAGTCTFPQIVAALGLPTSAMSNVSLGDVSDLRTTTSVISGAPVEKVAALQMYVDSTIRADTSAARKYAHDRFGVDDQTFDRLELGQDDGTVDQPNLTLSAGRYHDTTRLVVPFKNFDGLVHFVQSRDLHDTSRAKWSGPTNPKGAKWGRYGVFTGDTGWNEVLICEGPGDALSGQAAGYDTVAIPGASLATNADVVTALTTNLKDRHVILVGDTDASGSTFNAGLADALVAGGLHVSVLTLPVGPGVKDLTDWRGVSTDWPGDLIKAVRSATRVTEPTPEFTGTRAEALKVKAAERSLAFTETANADRLHHRLGGMVRYCGALGFLLWDGASWVVDTENYVMNAAQNSARAMGSEALRMPADHPGRASALSWAKKSATAVNMDAVIKILRTMDGVPVSAAALDTHDHLIACANGTIDLRTGTLKPADPADLITQSLPWDYDPNAKAPRWEQFINECHPGNPGIQRYLQTLSGYCVTGSSEEQGFIIHNGNGGNGKSVFTSTLHHVFRAMTAVAAVESFLMQSSQGSSGAGPSPDIAALRSARLVLTSEPENGSRLAEGKIKLLSGNEPLTARFLHKELFTFTPSFTVMMSTNHLPDVRGQDKGIWRRIKVVQWDQDFTGARREKHLEVNLRKETLGILAWVVRGAVRWYAEGLVEPSDVTAAATEYRDATNKLDGFVPGVFLPEGFSTRTVINVAYQDWCRDQGVRPWEPPTLYGALRQLGVVEKKVKGTRGFVMRKALPSER